MPTYLFSCECGTKFDRYLSFANYDAAQYCRCGRQAARQICAPAMVKVAPNICYDSPITGEPITSMSQRMEDLARHNCRPYDPEMRTDYENRLKREDAELDRSVEQTVEREIATMSAQKRERLVNEIAAGADAEIVRSTA